MKKTYQTPVITAVDIAVESQILAGSSSLGFGKDPIDNPGGQILQEWDTSWTTRRKKTTVRTGSNLKTPSHPKGCDGVFLLYDFFCSLILLM